MTQSKLLENKDKNLNDDRRPYRGQTRRPPLSTSMVWKVFVPVRFLSSPIHYPRVENADPEKILGHLRAFSSVSLSKFVFSMSRMMVKSSSLNVLLLINLVKQLSKSQSWWSCGRCRLWYSLIRSLRYFWWSRRSRTRLWNWLVMSQIQANSRRLVTRSMSKLSVSIQRKSLYQASQTESLGWTRWCIQTQWHHRSSCSQDLKIWCLRRASMEVSMVSSTSLKSLTLLWKISKKSSRLVRK